MSRRTTGVARALCEVTREELHRQDSRADAFVVGRRTFEDLRGDWPEQSDDATGIAEYLNRLQKLRCLLDHDRPEVAELDRPRR